MAMEIPAATPSSLAGQQNTIEPFEKLPIARRDLLDYVASFSADFSALAHQSRLPRLSMLLDMVTAEAQRERDGQTAKSA